MTAISNSYLKKWQNIPRAVKIFLLRCVLLFVAWKIIYFCFLVPNALKISPFTYIAGSLTAGGLNLITQTHNYSSKSEVAKNLDFNYNSTHVLQQSVYFHQKRIVGIYDACNALDLVVLYAGFIVCMPALPKRKLIYSGVGIVLVFAVNILRCMGIAYLIQYYPKQAEFAHHFVFVFIVYALIVALWLLFVRDIRLKDDGKQ